MLKTAQMKYVVSFLAVMLVGISASMAQPLPPPIPQSYYPIDGVVGLLLVLGLVYGGYSLFASRTLAEKAK